MYGWGGAGGQPSALHMWLRALGGTLSSAGTVEAFGADCQGTGPPPSYDVCSGDRVCDTQGRHVLHAVRFLTQ